MRLQKVNWIFQDKYNLLPLDRGVTKHTRLQNQTNVILITVIFDLDEMVKKISLSKSFRVTNIRPEVCFSKTLHCQ